MKSCAPHSHALAHTHHPPFAHAHLHSQSSDYEEYVASFRPDIMEPVTAWVRGARFAELSKMTEIFEVGHC